MLEIRNVHKTFNLGTINEKHALNGVDLKLDEGDFVTVIGGNGAGKSTMLNAVAGTWPVDEGSILIDGVDVTGLPEFKRATFLGRVFQDPMTALNPLKKIGAHLTEVLMRYRKLNKKQAREEAIEALRKVGIPSPEKRLDQYPHEFSGGMRQRVLIAMALCCKPKLLIADEPTTALDVTIQAQILELLKQLRDEEKMSVVLITHDLGVVASLSNRISVMYGGLIMEEGLTDEIFYAPKHPYTRALLHAIPQPTTGVKERLEAIPGMAPSLTNPPAGCPFAERCKYACEKCESEMPAYRQYTRTQRAMCVFTEEELNAMDKEGKADGRTE